VPTQQSETNAANAKIVSLIPKEDYQSIIKETPDTLNVLPVQQVKKLEVAHPTPTVANLEKFTLHNTVATNVTDFSQGQDGQHVHILGDGFTSVGAGGTKIKTVSGVNSVLAANIVYEFTRFGGIWYENGST
jgi:hypothetical protein